MEKQADFYKITELLKRNKLPYKDLLASNVEFITEEQNGVLLGCIGIEKYAENGLLRSFAVDEDYQNKGIGKRLIEELLSKSKTQGIQKIHLLTTTAESYFKKYGFQSSKRTKAPQSISQSKEFSELCPETSTYMTIKLS